MEHVPYCHVILAVDVRVRGETSLQALASRIRRDTESARQSLERWLKERDPSSVVTTHSGVSIAPSGMVTGPEPLLRSLLDKSTRPEVVESAVIVDS